MSDPCRMILRRAYGLGNKTMAVEIGVRARTVGKWHRRLLEERIDGFSDELRPERPSTIRQ